MSTLTFTHPELGTVTVIERAGSHKLSARWVNGRLRVNLPAGLTRSQIADAVSRHVADFKSMKPKPRFSPGDVIDCGGNFGLRIVTASTGQKDFDVSLSPLSSSVRPEFTITVPAATDSSSAEFQQKISNCIHLAARYLAPTILIARGRQLAAELGLRVDSWEIAHGKTTLGTCYPRQRRIRLSYMVMLLTPELRDYIIYHELAHLTEPGHTDRFHRLCDSYCGGREAELVSLLRRYPWPVDR